MTRFLALVALATSLAVETAPAPARRLPRAVLEDKVRGGWAGQMIGVSFGAPTEFQSNGKINEGELDVDARAWSRTRSTRTTSTWR